MSIENVTIRYAGMALDNGTMEVRDLAPSLLALAEVFEQTNNKLFKDSNSIKILVNATSKGSFEVTLDVVVSFATQIALLLGTQEVTTAIEIVKLIFGDVGFIGLFDLIKKTKNKKITSVNKLSNGQIQINFSDIGSNSSITVSSQVFNLYNDKNIRRATKDFTVPLRNEGIENITALSSGIEKIKILKEDIDAFIEPEQEETLLSTYEAIMILGISTLNFKGESWKVSDGDNTFWAKMADERFQKQVDKNVASFRKGDKIKAKIKVVQKQLKDSSLKTEYEILEVQDHMKGSDIFQTSLDLK